MSAPSTGREQSFAQLGRIVDKAYRDASHVGRIAEKLGKAREVAQETGDPQLLYLIDMAICQACESITAISGPSVVKDLKQRRNKLMIDE
jgi:hypothetical protein